MTKDKKSGLFSWFRKKEHHDDENNSSKTVHLTENEAVTTDLSLSESHLHPEETLTDEPVQQQSLVTPITQQPEDEEKQDTNVPFEVMPAQPDTKTTSTALPIEPPSKTGLFSRLKSGLLKTKQNIGSGFITLFRGKKIDDALFDELEEQLLIADVGVNTTQKLINTLIQHASKNELRDADSLYNCLKKEMSTLLEQVSKPLTITEHQPFVILMVGVNGVGKTTTIGKLAKQFQQQGKSVMLAAGDTFRAAAVEQLQIWGERNNIPVIAHQTGTDAASVIFEAMQIAKAKKMDILIVDTAGRLQNKAHLMNELKKIVRVIKKQDETAPHEVMLTIDASTGQNAISQAKLFNESVPLTGITLTKLDGTAKGGVIFALADQFTIPIRFIGIGEKIDDLRTFNADDFITALFDHEDGA